ncbi:MAG: acetyl-CoA carboxylase carboxyltransferase component [Nitriliruptoraceae bacterium]|jgi:acetyl-CoA carboxylase carboxyltransferase component
MVSIVHVTSTVDGVVVAITRAVGDELAPGTPVVMAELMKLEQPVVAPDAGVLVELLVAVGDTITRGTPVARMDLDATVEAAHDGRDIHSTGERAELAALRARQHRTTDAARPDAVAQRHDAGWRTARENVAELLDEGSFVEYGALAHAAQRLRRDADELQRRTPADGIITGLGQINGLPVAVAAYDFTVLAGTQGIASHHKLDRILGVARDLGVPFVLYAEGGGGRPGDTDVLMGAWLGVPTFRLLARLSGVVPTVAVVHGRTFAGNALLAGVCDVVIATEGSVLGMAGPAMVRGGGLGTVDADELGPAATHARTGAVDMVVADEAAATVMARELITLLRGDRTPPDDVKARDQAELRDLVPTDSMRSHDASLLLELVADVGSLVELRRATAFGMRTALARLDGRPVGLLANDPTHLAGAIDGDGAESAARFLALCDAHGLPVVTLVDTPGFMVGPESDAEAAVRRTSRLLIAGANLRVPTVAVVIRRAFGLGAMAMTGGDLQAPLATFAWPSAELGPMGLQGAVRLGARRELDQIQDPVAREAHVAELLDRARSHASAVNVATFAEIDDVIDPADTRARIIAVLTAAPPPYGPRRQPVPAW